MTILYVIGAISIAILMLFIYAGYHTRSQYRADTKRWLIEMGWPVEAYSDEHADRCRERGDSPWNAARQMSVRWQGGDA